MKNLIFIVEDDESILFNIKLSLEMNEYDVITATNGLEALSRLKSLKKIPDLILSDIMMPEMNGYDLYKSLFADESFKNIPFIFLSALSSPEDIVNGKNLGVKYYITKPINEDVLLSAIKNSLQK